MFGFFINVCKLLIYIALSIQRAISITPLMAHQLIQVCDGSIFDCDLLSVALEIIIFP